MAPDLRPGSMLTRSYQLVRPIAEGGMGCVWVAEHVGLERHVAIKVMSSVLATPAARELFGREARVTARVTDPHVVRVLDYDVTDDGLPFLVLELLEGETLEDHIVRTGPLSLAQAAAVLEQIGSALHATHACGVLHRDVKAENVFLVWHREHTVDVRLLDFGVAVSASRDRTPLLVGPVGTPQYMSPEAIVDAPLDERSDLFSLAICMYYALTGIFPFAGESVVERASLAAPPVPISELRRDLPCSIDTWFSRALARDRDVRFATAQQMCDAFTKSLTHESPVPVEVAVRAREVAPPAKKPRRAARWIAAAVITATIAVGAIRHGDVRSGVAYIHARFASAPAEVIDGFGTRE